MSALNMICFTLLAGLAGSGGAEESLRSWEEGCKRLASYDVYVTRKRKLPLHKNGKPRGEPLVYQECSRQVFSRGKRRIEHEVARPGQRPTAIVVWDGNVAKSLHVKSEQFTVTLRFRAGPGDYEAIYRRAGGDTWHELMRERRGTRLERQDGTQFVLYTPPTPEGGFQMSPFGFRVWLDSTKNFLPTRVQRLLEVSGEDVVYTQSEHTLEEVEPGVWVPTRVVTSHYPYPSTVPSESPLKSAESVLTVDLNLSRFNVEIPDSTFELKPAEGARTFDYVGFLEAKMERAFERGREGQTGILEALADARSEHKHVLIAFGRPSSRPLRMLFDFFSGPEGEHRGIQIQLADYELVAFDVSNPGQVAEFTKEYGVRVGDEHLPALLVLGPEGDVVGKGTVQELGKPTKYVSLRRVSEFLARCAPEKLDARELLSAALERARREDRSVFLMETGPGCAACVRLYRFLDDLGEVFERDYVILKIDSVRHKNGAEVIGTIRGDGGGIPWFAVLDGEGKALVTSNGPEGNIGFPNGTEGIGHFMMMIERTAKRMTPEQLDRIGDALREPD